MGKVKTVTISHTLDGTSGNTTTETSHFGKILAVEVDYPAGTVTVDIDAVNTVGANEKVLDLAAASTDIKVYPRVKVQDNIGTDIDATTTETTNLYDYFVVNGKLKLSLASGTTTQTVTVRVFLED